jgi:BirA family biotin operon repressor/biotin-[acetyl-CoA-carboxylase] ligase
MGEGIQEKWFDVDRVRSGLISTIFGNDIMLYDVVDSTNSIARDSAKEGKPKGTIIMAKTQNEGYGRLKRYWFSPSGGLWFSTILRPSFDTTKAPLITLMAGVAVSETLNKKYPVTSTIKWPNDVLVNGKKICGIITEMRTNGSNIGYIILGTGINVNFMVSDLPEDLQVTSTTLKEEMGDDVDLEDLLIGILKSISHYLQKMEDGDFDVIVNRWKESSDTLGRKVRIELEGESMEGVAQDLDENGALILKKDSGDSPKIFAGDCIHLTVSEGKE